MFLKTKRSSCVIILVLTLLSQLSYANPEQAKILYEETLHLSPKYHVPVSHAAVQGIKTKIVLDTAGSGAPFLTEKFAKKAKIISQAKKVTSSIFLDKKIVVDLGSVEIKSPIVGIAKSREKWFKKHHIAGLFNPVTVGPATAVKNQVNNVVLDFLAKRFYGVQASDQKIIDDYLDKRYAKQIKIIAPLYDNEYYKLIVQGGIEGKEEVPVLIDTGANSSSFDKSYLAGIPVIKRSRVRNFAGQNFFENEIAAQPISINGKVIGKAGLSVSEVRIDVGPSPSNKSIKRQGIIGMDLLKNCAIVIAYPQQITFYCTPQD